MTRSQPSVTNSEASDGSDGTGDTSESGDSQDEGSQSGSEDSGSDSEDSGDSQASYSDREEQDPTATNVEEDQERDIEDEGPLNPSMRAIWRVSIAVSDSTDVAHMKRLLLRYEGDVCSHENPKEFAEYLREHSASPEVDLSAAKSAAVRALADVLEAGAPLATFCAAAAGGSDTPMLTDGGLTSARERLERLLGP